MGIVNADWLHHEIMVNGCDVSCCEYYQDGRCSFYKDFECEKFPKCHYKRMKRAEIKICKIDAICTDVLENYHKHSFATIGLAGKITDIISEVEHAANE